VGRDVDDRRDIVRGMSEPSSDRPAALDDPGYRAAVVDLLGVLSLGELTAFERLAADAEMAPTLADKAALAAMAVAEFHHFERLRDRLAELGVDTDRAMAPFRDPLEAFHDHTAPSDWLEGLVKAYVGDGLATDFYREIAVFLPDPDRDLVLDVLADTGHAGFAVREVRAAISRDRRLAGRLSLWGRRLVGEAISQSQAVIAEHGRLHERLVELGADPSRAMAPFVAALDAFHESTRPSNWLEGLVKAYVGDGLATDFYREIAVFLPPRDRDLVLEVLADTGHADFAVREVRAAIAKDRRLPGRLSLWGRRLVGEAISQSQAVIAEHDRLATLIIEGTGDLAGVGRLIERITSAHTDRMKALGLNP